MKTLIKGAWKTKKIWLDGKELPANDSYKMNREAPEFSWGNVFAGASQLSFAILEHFFDKEIAEEWKGIFRNFVIALLPENSFEIHLDVKRFIRQKMRERL